MSGLLAQSVSPLALMKSDNQESHQGCELHAHATDWAAPGLRWRPLSFITSLLRLPNFNQLNLHSNIAMRNSSSRFGERLGTEAFPVFHHRPDNPSEFVGRCDGHNRAGFFASSPTIQSRKPPFRLLTTFRSDVAPSTSNFLMYRLPAFVMAPRDCLPPVEFCRGVRPSQAAKWRPDPNTLESGTLAAMTEATSLPTPGISLSDWLISLRAWALAISFSRSSIPLSSASICRPRTCTA